jgi:hypothetical protein
MRILLTLTACFGLALFASAAQHDDQNDQQYKKKGSNAQTQQSVAPTGGGKVYGNKQFKHQNFQQPNTVGGSNAGNKAYKNKWQGPVTGNTSNISGNAASSKFNKTNVNKNVNVNKNLTVNKNFKFQKKQFNLQTKNKQLVVNKYKTINYNANYKIAGAYKWKGPKYQVFVNYHPAWHDAWWYNWHHPHVVFIYGGWYYWDNYYWYPAWGYAPDSVYVVDAPIYASNPADDPAQVVANVQSALQEQGYYQGDVDGILGPQTRAALAEYQSAQGLEPTGLVDEPTLETLGMA